MIATLLIQIFLLIIIPNPKTGKVLTKTEHVNGALHHKAEELCELSKAHWHSDPKQAVAYGKEAIKVASNLKDEHLLARAYNTTGAGFFYLRDYNTAADYYKKALKLREVLADTSGMSSSYNNIGNVHYNQFEYPKALSYYYKSLRLGTKIQDTVAISRALNNLGNVYQSQHKPAIALKYFLKAIPLEEKIKDNKGIIVSLINVGVTYQQQGKYELALTYLERGLELTIQTNNLHDRIYAYRGLAETYQGLKEYQKALYFGEHSLKLSKETQSIAEAKTSAQVLHKIYSEVGDYKQAYNYLNQFVAYSDSIKTEEIARQTTSFRVKYETAQKEKENLKLLAEHELHKQEIEHKTLVQYTIIGLLALSLTVVILVYIGNRRTRRMNKQLNRKNKKVSKYSENIKHQKNELAKQALELQNKKEELEKLNQLKDKLFSIVAHDLRGPLLSLKSLLQVLAMGKISEEQFLYFTRTLEAEQQNTLWLVDNLLLWAKSQMEGTAIKKEQISIYTLTDDTISLLAPQANRKGIQLHNLALHATPAYADADMIQLVLRNLISNAIKFCNEGDSITIETELKNNMLQVAVQDTGAGIPVEKQAKLFGLRTFTSLGTKKEKGSGLGLAMCRDFVETNGGTIWVESNTDEGCTFKFTLPCLTEAIANTPELQAAESL